MVQSQLPTEPGQFEPGQQNEQLQYPSQPLTQQTSYNQLQQYQEAPSQPLPQQQYAPYPPSLIPNPPTRPRKSFGRIILWLTIGILIGLAIGYPIGHSSAGYLSANTANPQQSVTTGSQSTPNTSAPTSQPTNQPTSTQQTINHVGDTLTNSIWAVTLNSVKTSAGDQYDTPAAGNIYLIVDVTAKNLSTSPQILSSAGSFTLKDDTGQAYQETIISSGTPPDASALQPGDKLRGQITYEIPKSLHHFTFQFQDESGGTGTWEFSI
jgi:hypothetical protein